VTSTLYDAEDQVIVRGARSWWIEPGTPPQPPAVGYSGAVVDSGKTAVYTCTLNASNGGLSASIPVIVSPAAPSIALDPDSLDFGNVTVGGSLAKDVSIGNRGSLDLVVSNIARCAGTSDEFTWSRSVPFTVTPGTSLTVPVTYTPSGSGSDTGCLQFTNNDSENPSVSLTLTGAGTSPPIADLLVTSLSSPPAIVPPGTKFVVTETTRNQGALGAGLSTTRFYLSLDQARSSGDRLLTGSHAVPALIAGASSAATITVKVPAATPLGTYWLLACADDKRVVVESDEANNCVGSPDSVLVALPDLVTTSLSAPPAQLPPGGKFTIGDSVRNQGTAPAAASTSRYYLSLDGVRDAGDVLLTGTRAIVDLAPGATGSGSKLVTVPLVIAPATYYVIACADDTLKVPEQNEANNCTASALTVLVGWPDLVTTEVSDPPAQAVAAGKFSIADTVINGGNVVALASTTRYYLSLDGVKSSGDVPLIGTRAVVSLVPGATSTGSRLVTVPLGTAAGTYFVLACADDRLKVGESDETNNCRAASTLLLVGAGTAPTGR
jgi:hypothetical protein